MTTLIIGLLVPMLGDTKWAVVPTVIGFLLGMGFLLLIDVVMG